MRAKERERERERERANESFSRENDRERHSCRSFDAEWKHEAHILPLVSRIAPSSLLPIARYCKTHLENAVFQRDIFNAIVYRFVSLDGISPYRPLSIFTDNLRQSATRRGILVSSGTSVTLAAASAHRLEYLQKPDARLNFLPLRLRRRARVFPVTSTPTFPKRNSIQMQINFARH